MTTCTCIIIRVIPHYILILLYACTCMVWDYLLRYSDHAHFLSPSQGYVVCSSEQRFLLLFTFLKKNVSKKLMVFFSSCNSVKFHSELLNYIDIPVMEIHVRHVVHTHTHLYSIRYAYWGTIAVVTITLHCVIVLYAIFGCLHNIVLSVCVFNSVFLSIFIIGTSETAETYLYIL